MDERSSFFVPIVGDEEKKFLPLACTIKLFTAIINSLPW
jgi:F0F1-type ATP synthase membrane subunit a